MISFNIDEIFRIAERIEQNGVKYYSGAAEVVKDQQAQRMLATLAEMERIHEKTFRKMASELPESQRKAESFDAQETGIAYLRAVADGKIFDPGSVKLTGDESLQDVLSQAMALEKESVVFYSGMKKYVPEQLGKQWLTDIIDEEFSHIVMISDAMEKNPEVEQ